jgi:TonB family protein
MICNLNRIETFFSCITKYFVVYYGVKKIQLMEKVKNSGAVVFRLLISVLTIVFAIIIMIPSCSRSKKGLSGLTTLEPPPLPPPPPKVPSMTGSDTTWNMFDQIPMFPGGEELLVKHIAMNTIYPETAKAKRIQGKVVVKFCITRKGSVNGYEVVQSVSPELDAEALRVVKTITRFEPAIVDGKPVSAWYYLPISFTLK